jgi:hypothetical protein
MQRIRTFISKKNGRLANLDNYNINKDSSFTPGILTFPILGGSLQVKFLFCIEITLRILIKTSIKTLEKCSKFIEQ